MSANKTANYRLNQWEPEDKVLRTEFNEDNKKIEDALTALAAADKTESAARKALETAITGKGNCSVGFFTYQGTGSTTTTINFPRKPFAFIAIGFTTIMIGWGGINAACLSNGATQSVVWSGNQFKMEYSGEPRNYVNNSTSTYYVTAF